MSTLRSSWIYSASLPHNYPDKTRPNPKGQPMGEVLTKNLSSLLFPGQDRFFSMKCALGGPCVRTPGTNEWGCVHDLSVVDGEVLHQGVRTRQNAKSFHSTSLVLFLRNKIRQNSEFAVLPQGNAPSSIFFLSQRSSTVIKKASDLQRNKSLTARLVQVDCT